MVDIILTETDPVYSPGFGGGPQAAMLTEDDSTFFANGGGGPAELGLTELPPIYPAPQVKTGPATEIGLLEATINGLLEDDGGFTCDCAFEWGLTEDYGNVTPLQGKAARQDFSQVLIGLDPDTIYHFRAIASNVFGLSRGADRALKTLSAMLPSYFQNPLISLLDEDLP
jgi:hypothetical protein